MVNPVWKGIAPLTSSCCPVGHIPQPGNVNSVPTFLVTRWRKGPCPFMTSVPLLYSSAHTRLLKMYLQASSVTHVWVFIKEKVMLLQFSPISLRSFFVHCPLTVFRWAHPWHMEVPRLGSNRSCSRWPTWQPQQRQIQGKSPTHTIVHSNARSLTHWARPGIKPSSSWLGSLPLSCNGNARITTNFIQR